VNVPFLDLSRAVAASRAELDGAVARVLDESRYVLGPQVEAFEQAFAAWCGAAYAVGVASGTDALALALRAVGVGPGDEVVTAANTCVPTVAAIEAAGGRPVLADVDGRTRTLDPERLVDACTERTRAIVPVHLYGRCADMGPIRALAAERRLAVVEDAAQAHGAALGGRRAGALGDAAAFSFYPTKNLGALGDGGAVVTDDPDLAERVRMLRSYGERERYDSVASGTNSRLDTLQAAVLLARLPGVEAANERRRAIAARYTEALAGLPLELPDEPVGGVHAFHLYVVSVADRERFRAGLAERGVETLVHYARAIHEHPAYRGLARPGELDVSERLAREVVSLPLYPELTDDEAEAVVAAVRAAST
jgi:dTDP-3-amino-3,4,6-trideoxy-alpha-D-glucose transaminase